jgi:hypothetical protein
LQALENRLTPSTNALTTSNLVDVTSAPTALAAPTAGPQVVTIEIDGMLRLDSGGAEQATSFKIDDVASLSLSGDQGETCLEIRFHKSIALEVAGHTETADIQRRRASRRGPRVRRRGHAGGRDHHAADQPWRPAPAARGAHGQLPRP